MKKILSILMVVALIATMLTVGAVTTSAADTATITIYGIDGSSDVKELNVGDVFTVYTTLDASASAEDGMIGSVEGYQTYSADVLSLQDAISGQYGEFVDRATVFPVTRNATMSNGSVAGRIDYNASIPSISNAFAFNSSYSKLIVTTYKVTSAGAGEVRNVLTTLAAADEAITKIVYQGQTQPGKSVSGGSYFEDPIPELDHAQVTIYKLDGTSEVLNFNIGDTVTVYSMLNIKGSINSGMASAVQAAQQYTPAVLNFEEITFPVLTGAMTNATTPGIVKYSAATASIDNGFRFDTDESVLSVATYTVKANGFAEISDSIVVLAAADEDATKIVFGGETQPGKSFTSNTTFTEPGTIPTQPPTEKPTEKPTTQPSTEKPTEQPSTKTKVTIIGPNGSSVVKEVEVGSTFTVYTVLDITGSVADGKAANVEGSQTYDTAKLQLTDAVSGTYNEIVDKTAMFPIMGNLAVASANNGVISFNASKPGIDDGFVFNSDKSKLIVTNYKALQAGETTIQTNIKTLVASDAAVTKIVYKGALQEGMSIDLHASYTDPGQAPTEPPTEKPTEKPTEPPTEKPTEAPTEKPTTPPTNKAVITIVGFDGTSEVKTFNVGETFTVYTVLDASQAIPDAQVASLRATQTFPSAIVSSTAQVDSYGVIKNTTTMFPVLGTAAVAKLSDGAIEYNASTPYIGEGFEFDEDALLIVSEYTVTASGTGTIANSITTLAAADEALTRIINKGVIQGDYVIGGASSFTEPGTVVDTYMLGDSDGNDAVESLDVTYIMRYQAEVAIPISIDTLMNGDVDRNGYLEIIDATYIQRFLAEFPVPYPIGEYVERT